MLPLPALFPSRSSVSFKLPAIETAADVTKALSAVAASMASGDLTPEEANAVASVIEAKRKAVETQELESRIVVLEQAAQERCNK